MTELERSHRLAQRPLAALGARRENMKLGDIYRFILKGATPVARHPSVQKRVGAAWNYATGRLPQNTWDRLGRVVRFQR